MTDTTEAGAHMRERIARLIDPFLWDVSDCDGKLHPATGESLATTDRIMAEIIAPLLAELEGAREARSIAFDKGRAVEQAATRIMRRRAEAAEARVAQLEEALKPFAAFELWTDIYPDGPLRATGTQRHVRPEWVVAARAALIAKLKEQTHE